MQVSPQRVALPALFKKSLRRWQEQYKASLATEQQLTASPPELTDSATPPVAEQPHSTIRIRPRPSKVRR
jgi:hypothetical protein